MATVLITGGTGLIGQAITKELIAKGYDVIILSRNPNKGKQLTEKLSYAAWDLVAQTIDEKAIQKADYIIQLAGANVAGGRWTEKRKKEIVESRTKSGELLVRAVKNIPNKIKAVISASAIGFYGADPAIPNPKPFVENDPADDSFLGRTSVQWESSMDPITESGKRLVKLRTGIVLSNDGGAYVEFKKPLKFGIASVLGTGQQVVSWIHINDIVGIYIYAIENEKLKGVYNAVAPQPVSNKKLIETMSREKVGVSITAAVPEFVLKTIFGEMSIEILKSATVNNDKIHQAGFTFLYPSIKAALENLMK